MSRGGRVEIEGTPPGWSRQCHLAVVGSHVRLFQVAHEPVWCCCLDNWGLILIPHVCHFQPCSVPCVSCRDDGYEGAWVYLCLKSRVYSLSLKMGMGIGIGVEGACMQGWGLQSSSSHQGPFLACLSGEHAGDLWAYTLFAREWVLIKAQSFKNSIFPTGNLSNHSSLIQRIQSSLRKQGGILSRSNLASKILSLDVFFNVLWLCSLLVQRKPYLGVLEAGKYRGRDTCGTRMEELYPAHQECPTDSALTSGIAGSLAQPFGKMVAPLGSLASFKLPSWPWDMLCLVVGYRNVSKEWCCPCHIYC